MTRTTRSRRIAASSSSEDEAVVPAATAKVRAAAAAAPTPRKRAKKASTTTTASTTLRQTTLTQLPRPRLAARSSGWQAPAVSSIIDVEVSSNAGDADFVPCAGHWTSGAIDSRLWMDKYAPVTEVNLLVDGPSVHVNIHAPSIPGRVRRAQK